MISETCKVQMISRNVDLGKLSVSLLFFDMK